MQKLKDIIYDTLSDYHVETGSVYWYEVIADKITDAVEEFLNKELDAKNS